MKQYYRIMLGKQSAHAAECLSGGFIGADFGIHQDLTRKLPAEWREFNREFIPIYQARNPGKTKIGAGLACAALWTIAKGNAASTWSFSARSRSRSSLRLSRNQACAFAMPS